TSYSDKGSIDEVPRGAYSTQNNHHLNWSHAPAYTLPHERIVRQSPPLPSAPLRAEGFFVLHMLHDLRGRVWGGEASPNEKDLGGLAALQASCLAGDHVSSAIYLMI